MNFIFRFVCKSKLSISIKLAAVAMLAATLIGFEVAKFDEYSIKINFYAIDLISRRSSLLK